MIKYLRYLVVCLFIGGMAYWTYTVLDNYGRQTTLALMVQEKQISPSEPIGGSGGDATSKAPVAAPVNKVKVLGIVELEISQAATWTTIFQILAIILGSSLGIRIINSTFKKIEQQ